MPSRATGPRHSLLHRLGHLFVGVGVDGSFGDPPAGETFAEVVEVGVATGSPMNVSIVSGASKPAGISLWDFGPN